MVGIKETKELVKAMLMLGNSAGMALADGKFDWSELGLFVAPLGSLPAALSGLQDLPKEWQDMDDSERDELMKYVQDEFDIPQDNIEEMVEKALQAGILIGQIVANFTKPKSA